MSLRGSQPMRNGSVLTLGVCWNNFFFAGGLEGGGSTDAYRGFIGLTAGPRGLFLRALGHVFSSLAPAQDIHFSLMGFNNFE